MAPKWSFGSVCTLLLVIFLGILGVLGSMVTFFNARRNKGKDSTPPKLKGIPGFLECFSFE